MSYCDVNMTKLSRVKTKTTELEIKTKTIELKTRTAELETKTKNLRPDRDPRPTILYLNNAVIKSADIYYTKVICWS